MRVNADIGTIGRLQLEQDGTAKADVLGVLYVGGVQRLPAALCAVVVGKDEARIDGIAHSAVCLTTKADQRVDADTVRQLRGEAVRHDLDEREST